MNEPTSYTFAKRRGTSKGWALTPLWTALLLDAALWLCLVGLVFLAVWLLNLCGSLVRLLV